MAGLLFLFSVIFLLVCGRKLVSVCRSVVLLDLLCLVRKSVLFGLRVNEIFLCSMNLFCLSVSWDMFREWVLRLDRFGIEMVLLGIDCMLFNLMVKVNV